MKEFSKLLQLADTLLGPKGCPWDREQTFYSLQSYLLEEVHEVIEAIDDEEYDKLSEELGDLLYALIFVIKVAEKNKIFTAKDVIQKIHDKLVRRHPHVFGEIKIKKMYELYKQWEEIKKQEKSHSNRKSELDGIPPTLPILSKAQKILGKIQKSDTSSKKNPEILKVKVDKKFESEEELGESLIKIILKAEKSGFQVEDVLRRSLSKYETRFRESE